MTAVHESPSLNLPPPESEPAAVHAGRQPGQLLVVLLLAGLVAWLYWPTALELVNVWNLDPNYSHGFLVPLLSLLFAVSAWRRCGRPLQPAVGGLTVAAGLGRILAGVLLHMAAQFVGSLLFDVVSLIILSRGILLVLGGREGNQRFGFAVLFLIFMAPLPMAWYQPVAVAMQQIVSGISAEILELCGAAVYREGYLIHLPGYTMEVGEACSGLRQLTAVLALAVAIGHFSGRGTAYCWTLALLAFPLALAANCLRVVLSGVIMLFFGAQWAEGVFHTLEGMVIIGLAAVLTIVVAVALARLEDGYRNQKPQVPT